MNRRQRRAANRVLDAFSARLRSFPPFVSPVVEFTPNGVLLAGLLDGGGNMSRGSEALS
jgi:hypothetical protein